MPTSLRSFSTRMRRLAATIDENTGHAISDVATKVHTTLVFGTPVDRTDRADDIVARANWNIGINGPDDTFRPDRGPEEVLREGRDRMEFVSDGTEVYISNGGNKIPYLRRLNDGHSGQAPKGFIQTAVRAGVKEVKNVRILRRRR